MDDLLKKTVIAAGITSIIYMVLFLFLDRFIDLWIHNHYSNSPLSQLGTYISYAANGNFINLGLTAGFILIIIIDPNLTKRWTRNLLYICLTGSIAIIIGEGLKYILGRYRPVMLFENNLYGLHFFSSKSALHSTPSGHTIRAFSLLTALSLVYRRCTVVFMAVAVLVGASRVAVTAHYPGDVIVGAFIGIFTAAWTYQYFFVKNREFPQDSPQ
jgi:membrane-associated phospholipid phosphatase